MTKLILLPGWTKKGADYQELLALLGQKFSVSYLDFPTLGNATLSDYASFVSKNISGPAIFLGHSFGGRVALKTALLYPHLVSQLILVNSAGIERKTPFIKFLSFLSPHIPQIPHNPLANILGSPDYRATSGPLRQTFKNIILENLEPDLPKITTPTLLIWGEQDHTTPLWQGKLMNKLIKNSQLEIIPGDHGLPYRQPQKTANAIFSNL